MPLLKNPEFTRAPGSSPHLRIGRLNFITTGEVIKAPKTRLAILDLIPFGFTDSVETVGVELKPRPRERLGFEVVTDCESELKAAVLTFRVPMQAMLSAGVDISRLSLAAEPSLVSSAGSSTPTNALVEVYEGLQTAAGNLSGAVQGDEQARANVITLPTNLSLPGFAQVA